MSDALNIPFDELMEALLDDTTPLAPRFLYRFTDLPDTEIEKLKENWPNINADRRTHLIEDLEELAESNTLLSFDAVLRIGLKDENGKTRKSAIRALWESEATDLIHEFTELLENDPETEVRAQAAAGLGRFIYLGELEKIRADLFRPLEKKLLGLLEDGKAAPEIRQSALESLGFSGHVDVTGYIQQAYRADEDGWIISALIAMGRSAHDRWGQDVLDKIDDRNPSIRLEAARAAGLLELKAAKTALLYLLEDSESEVREAAIWSLSEIGGKEVVEKLEELLEESEDDAETLLLENALENLALIEETEDFDLFDYEEDDYEEGDYDEDEDD
jgi:HEAT repeat protein